MTSMARMILLALALLWPVASWGQLSVRFSGAPTEGGDFYVDLKWSSLPATLTYSLTDSRSSYELLGDTVVADVSAMDPCETASSTCRSLTIAAASVLVVGRCKLTSPITRVGPACTTGGECASGVCKSDRAGPQDTVLKLTWTWSGGGTGVAEIHIPIAPLAVP